MSGGRRIVAIAAILAAATMGCALPRTDGGIASPETAAMAAATASTTATATSVASPSPSGITSPGTVECEDDLAGCAGRLAGGEHRSVHFAPKLIYTTPAGWTNSIDTASIFKLDPPSGTGPSILIWTDVDIADQTTTCDPVARPGAGSAAKDWVAFLTTHPGLETTDPVQVDFHGSQDTGGQSVDVTVAADWTAVCPGGSEPTVALIAHRIEPKAMYGVAASERLRLTILDVRGETVVIEVYGPKDAQRFRSTVAIAQNVIDTFRFGCGPSVPRPCGAP